MKRILLINPAFTEDPTGLPQLFRMSVAAKWSPFQIGVMPLGLATIAALTPDRIQVDIWDESVSGPISGGNLSRETYDLAGVTGYVNHASRVNEIGRLLRDCGLPSAVGGPGVSSEPELYREHFDALFIGEAEYTWPQFIADYESGAARREYRQVSRVDMNHSPRPRWDQTGVKSYLLGAVQTTRGCPFDCEFCDVIYIYGRLARHKPIGQVLDEVRSLERLGIERILFCDDNFIGNLRYAKDLLKELKSLNRSFQRPVAFFTNVTLNAARDEELLALLADTGFCGVFIGVESTDSESLAEMNKPQNNTMDIPDAVRRIHSYGIVIQSGMIVGFDHDDTSVFDRHFAFLQETGVPVPMINLLKAPTGTKLWARLHREGRVFQSAALRSTSNVEPLTNVIPRRMSLAELLAGYIDLLERLRDWKNFEKRIQTFLSQIRRKPEIRRRPDAKKALLLLFMLGKMNGEARRTTLRLLRYTLRRAPFMVESVMASAAYQYQEALRLPHLKQFIGEHIRRLKAGEMRVKREQAAFAVPDGFSKAYPGVFPELYSRVYRGLNDKLRTEQVLVEVTSDFLTRCGRSFRQFEPQHLTFLDELCDRTIASENRSRPLNAGPPAPDDIRMKRLAQDVLRCVEQDLRNVHADV